MVTVPLRIRRALSLTRWVIKSRDGAQRECKKELAGARSGVAHGCAGAASWDANAIQRHPHPGAPYCAIRLFCSTVTRLSLQKVQSEPKKYLRFAVSPIR
jgi:hypothetical protein